MSLGRGQCTASALVHVLEEEGGCRQLGRHTSSAAHRAWAPREHTVTVRGGARIDNSVAYLDAA